jgi:hypothetical protein
LLDPKRNSLRPVAGRSTGVISFVASRMPTCGRGAVNGESPRVATPQSATSFVNDIGTIGLLAATIHGLSRRGAIAFAI